MFTDEDLKRLKAHWCDGSPEDEWGGVYNREMRALLARLEAAEDFMFADEESYDEKLAAWRKAAGK